MSLQIEKYVLSDVILLHIYSITWPNSSVLNASSLPFRNRLCLSLLGWCEQRRFSSALTFSSRVSLSLLSPQPRESLWGVLYPLSLNYFNLLVVVDWIYPTTSVSLLGDFPASDFKPLTFGQCRSRNFLNKSKITEELNVKTLSITFSTRSHWLISRPSWCNLFGIWLDVHLSEKTQARPAN